MTVPKKGAAYAAFALLAVVLMAAAVLMAAPAWSQDTQTREGPANTRDASTGNKQSTRTDTGQGSGQSERKGLETTTKQNTNTGTSSTQDKKKESRTARTPGSTSKSSAGGQRNRKTPSSTDPLARAEVSVENNGDSQVVNDGDVITIRGDYRVKSGATVTLRDRNGNGKGVKFGANNAEVREQRSGNLRIEVEGDLRRKLRANDLVVVRSQRVRNNDRRDGRRGNRGRGNGFDCDIIIDRLIRGNQRDNAGTDNASNVQYNNIEDVVLQCINQNPNRFDEDILDELLEELDDSNDLNDLDELLEDLEDDEDEDQDEEVRIVVEPDGELIDTSKLQVLPNTGGPGLVGSALVASSLALLGGGVGLSLWRLGNRRGRGGG